MKSTIFTKHRPLRVGTDCSGIEAPIVALQQLGLPFSHEFSSEIDKHCIATIKANFHPKILFGDMKDRKLKDIPDIDIYVCGFPCQPFSLAGKREGIRDPRGTLFWECLRVIRYKKPMIFVLENVRGLLSIDQGRTFQTILSELEKLKIYNVRWKVLNTADYGIPQSRKRVFLVGILKTKEKKPFAWPEPIRCRPLEEFVDWQDTNKTDLTTKNQSQLKKMNPQAVFLDLAFANKFFPMANKICSCICAKSNFINLYLMRPMNHKELCVLQGFPSTFIIGNAPKTVNIRMIGNSMSTTVLMCLFKSIFQTLG